MLCDCSFRSRWLYLTVTNCQIRFGPTFAVTISHHVRLFLPSRCSLIPYCSYWASPFSSAFFPSPGFIRPSLLVRSPRSLGWFLNYSVRFPIRFLFLFFFLFHFPPLFHFFFILFWFFDLFTFSMFSLFLSSFSPVFSLYFFIFICYFLFVIGFFFSFILFLVSYFSVVLSSIIFVSFSVFLVFNL